MYPLKRFCAIKRGSATALSYFMIVFLIMAIFGCIPEPFEDKWRLALMIMQEQRK